MLTEADPAEVIEHDGCGDGRGEGKASEDSRAETLREDEAGHGGGDADKPSEPCPGFDSDDAVMSGEGLA